MKPTFRIILIAAAALSASAGVRAHGGGLNADGCHVNRKTSDYHCHRSPAASQSYAPNFSTRNLAQSAPRAYGNGRQAGAFANCAEARAAGAAPVRIGEPGYGAHLDRDGDGIGCEPYRGRR